MRKKGKGAAYAILSAVLYGVSSVFTKTAASMGVTVSALLLLRGIIGMAILLAYTTASRKSIRLARNNYRKVLILGLFGTSSTLILLNCAYLYLPVGTVTTIHFFYPVVVNFINALIYREKVPRITLFTMTVCTLAILLFFESFDESRVAGVVLTLFSVASWTFQLIYIEHSGLLSERKESLSFYACCITAAVGAILGTLTGTLVFTAVVEALPFIVATALFNNVFANLFLQKGIDLVGAGTTAVLSVFEPISSLLFGAMVLNEKLSFWQIVACVTIILSVTVMLICITKEADKKSSA